MRISGAQIGFSLIELMIGIVIFGILIMAGLPSYTAWLQNTKIRTAAESIVNGLQLARAEAVRRNTNVQFVFGTDTDWTVSVVAPLTTVQSRSSAQGSAGVIVTRTPAAATTITFNSFGRVAANADGSASITQVDVDVPTTLLAATASRDLRITLGAGGNVRMCDPNVSAPDTRTC